MTKGVTIKNNKASCDNTTENNLSIKCINASKMILKINEKKDDNLRFFVLDSNIKFLRNINSFETNKF